MRKVSVIIPNYNGEKYLPECLGALKKQDFVDFDVIVVDNCSEDGSLEAIEECSEGLSVRVIALDNNYGFARAVNEGIKASDAEFAVLLNNDTRAGKHFVGALVERIAREDDIFSAQAMMLQYNERSLIDSAGDYFSALGWGFASGRDKPARNFNKECDIFSACAGAAIYRKSVFEQIGYFDEEFFAYLEDVDLGWRARLNGWRNVYAPKAKVLHIGSGSSGSRHNAFKVSLSARNSFLVMYKNLALWQKVLNLIPVAAGVVIKIIYFAKKNLASEYIKGVVSAFSKMKDVTPVENRPEFRVNRVRIQKELYRNILRRLGI